MKVVFDTSIWVEQLRRSALDWLLPHLRGRYQLAMDSVVAAELLAGCRSRSERRVVDGLVGAFRKTGRLLTPDARTLRAAGLALSRLREGGATLKSPGGAVIDAVIAATAAREGALLVTLNHADFAKLQAVLRVRVAGLDDLAVRLRAGGGGPASSAET